MTRWANGVGFVGLVVAGAIDLGCKGPTDGSGHPAVISASPPATIAQDGGDAEGGPEGASRSAAPTLQQVTAPRPAVADPPPDGGRCALVRGPFALPFDGALALVPAGNDVTVIANDDGAPRLIASPSLGTKLEPSARRSLRPLGIPCAFDGKSYFCADSTGQVHRTHAASSHVVAKSRSGTRIAAATTPRGKSVLAFIRANDDGAHLLEAWAQTDDAPPERISDEGAGATDVTLVGDRDGLLAVTIDGRASLTPVHSRRYVEDKGFSASPDEVVFVAGPPEARTRVAAAASADGVAFGMLALSASVSDFGLLVFPLETRERGKKTPSHWSLYPNGLDPAPIATITNASGIVVARIRPETRKAAARHVLEIGALDLDGEFRSLGVVPTHGDARDVALAPAGPKGLWVAYSDALGAWLEERQCR